MQNNKPHIDLKDIYVDGVDTLKRAQGLKQLVFGKGGLKGYEIPILKGASFSAKPGDRIGIVGRNGSGKSSLLKVIAGIYPPKSGIVDVCGSIAPLISMGIGFENDFTGRHNIKVGLLYSNRFYDYSIDMEEKIIEFSELGEKIDTPIKGYSSGMLARLSFSIAVFQNPDILLLDEVFATGDADFREKSIKLMREKFSSVPISILVTHSPEIILEMCNRCVWMEDGKVKMEGTTKNVISEYDHNSYIKFSALEEKGLEYVSSP